MFQSKCFDPNLESWCYKKQMVVITYFKKAKYCFLAYIEHKNKLSIPCLVSALYYYNHSFETFTHN